MHTQKPARIRLLLEHGINPNMQTSRDKSTALHICAMFDNKEGVDILLQWGADPSLRDLRGRLPEEACSSEEVSQCLRAARIEKEKAALYRELPDSINQPDINKRL